MDAQPAATSSTARGAARLVALISQRHDPCLQGNRLAISHRSDVLRLDAQRPLNMNRRNDEFAPIG